MSAEQRPRQGTWAHALKLYDSLCGDMWSHIPAFREVVLALSRNPDVAKMTAVTSHETLILSRQRRYPEWMVDSSLRLHPLLDGTVRIERVMVENGHTVVESCFVTLEAVEDETVRQLALL